MNLVLYSVFNKNALENFNNNVIKGISKSELKENISSSDYELLKDINKNTFRFWGCKNTKYYERKISRIQKDDTILFARNKKFKYYAKVISVIQSESLGMYLFNDNIYSNIIVLEDIHKIDISYENLFEELGYDSKLKVNGLFLVREEKCKEFFDKYNSFNEYYKNLISIKSVMEIIEK